MISINTNLQSMMVQSNLGLSTKGLNNAIERMSTGCKINHAKDNAANYSISRDYSSKLSSYTIAQENIAAGMDLVATAQDTISLMQDYGSRLHALVTQARNGTYGSNSLEAMTREAEAIVSEINRLQANTEYNDIKLFDGAPLPDWAEELKSSLTPKSNGFIADISTVTPDVVISDPNALAGAISSNSVIGIKNAETLAKLAELVNGGTTCSGKTIVLTENIDLSGWCSAHSDTGGWVPIGTQGQPFQGRFDGQGHTISGLYINNDSFYQGLFGYVRESGSIANIGVNVDITTHSEVGGLVGILDYGCSVENCYSTGSVTGINGNDVGGLIGNINGMFSGYVIVRNCYSTVSATGKYQVGGLIGSAFVEVTVENCYSTGNAVATDYWAGGLIGNAGGTIQNCYSTGTASAQDAVGGLVGANSGSVNGCYSTGSATGNANVGGLVGQGSGGTVNNCYYPDSNSLMTTIQVGIGGDESSKVEVNTSISFNLDSVLSNLRSDSAYSTINDFLETVNRKETELGAVANRLESALESTTTNINNLTSSLSTIKDADISKVSSEYIKQQILQQAAATLLSTANQQPSIALQLI